jgi:hypothetical protein
MDAVGPSKASLFGSIPIQCLLTFKISKYTHLELKKVWGWVMEGERKVSPNYYAVKWGVIDSKTNRQKNGQLS